MNRPIKFRAWNGKQFIPVAKVVDIGVEGELLVNPLVTLMQFTGLLDKNGKEIYERDVVRYQFLDGEWTEQPVVYGGAAFGVHGFLLNQISGDGTELEVEIIGNIYENPELIK